MSSLQAVAQGDPCPERCGKGKGQVEFWFGLGRNPGRRFLSASGSGEGGEQGREERSREPGVVGGAEHDRGRLAKEGPSLRIGIEGLARKLFD